MGPTCDARAQPSCFAGYSARAFGEARIVVTDTVEGPRATASRTIEFRFDAPVPTTAFDGLHVSGVEDKHVAVAVTGALGPRLARAAGLNPIDITGRPADLDELFFSYYRTDREGNARDD